MMTQRTLHAALNILGTLYRVIQSNITDTDNLMKLLAEEKEIVDKPGAEELKNAKGDIELEHVRRTFRRSSCELIAEYTYQLGKL